MSLITVGGSNPFQGQADPYLSIESSIDYSSSDSGLIKQTYILQGNIVACEGTELNTARTRIARAFDWKKNPSIATSIRINGVISANEKTQLIPVSLDFGESNYIGSIPYTVKLEMFTGYETGAGAGASILLNKVHTETITIDEKKMYTVSTNIGCSPNQTGQDALDASNAWIQERIKIAQENPSLQKKEMRLVDESLTIDTITSRIEFSNSFTEDPSIKKKDKNRQERNDFMVALCFEEKISNPQCPNSLVEKSYQGEVYKSGATEGDLVEHFANNVLSDFEKVKNVSSNFSSSSNRLSFNFEVDYDDPEEDKIVHDYTINEKTYYLSGGPVSTDYSVNGRFFILNPVETNTIEYSTQEVLDKVKSLVDGKNIDNYNINRENTGETISYNVVFNKHEDDNLIPNLDGISGLQSYSIQYTPSLKNYNVVYPLSEDCEPKIYELPYNSDGTFSININAVSGSGFDFSGNAIEKKDELIKILSSSHDKTTTIKDEFKLSENKDALTINYQSSFKATPPADGAELNGLF